jgi:hypothetical protein
VNQHVFGNITSNIDNADDRKIPHGEIRNARRGADMSNAILTEYVLSVIDIVEQIWGGCALHTTCAGTD